MMGDGRNDDARDDESWTEMESVQPDVVEVVPIRHGMVLGGRYVVEKIIGRGGSGVVVRAHDRDLRSSVAIKILRAELAGQREWTERLAREVRLARQIHHPHVCRVFDFQQADGRAFLVMELAEKGTLRDEMRSGALAARPVAARIADARAVASALEAIHRAGIVHRDLSPQNLLRMGDGRLVLSDFGLAVDVSDSTSSVHGGTVAYMAPEVLRGGKATFASDVWGLGVVMHELVFGKKPRWSDGASAAMLEPQLGRRLTEEERAVFETCRACTAKDPADRLVREGEVVRMLGERRAWWRRLVAPPRRTILLAGGLTVVAAAFGALHIQRRARDATAAVQESGALQSPLIIPTGEPADWTKLSTVLAEVPDRITCTRLLPDQRTIRFVWGTPPRAEDIDTVTRKRIPSPLVPAAYREGCPDLSPDGKRLVFQGHTAEGRAYAFLSEHPDGRDAVPAVPTAEPSLSSEPMWLGDGQTLAYDADLRHTGLFSPVTGRVHILPVTSEPFSTVSRFVIGRSVVVESIGSSGESEIVGFSVPDLKPEMRFRAPRPALDLIAEGSHLYYTSWRGGPSRTLVELDPVRRTAHALGQVADHVIRYPVFVTDGLTFVAISTYADVAIRKQDGSWGVLTKHGKIWSAARCGRDLIVSAETDDGRTVIKRLDGSGTTSGILTTGPIDLSAACSPDSKTWFYSTYGPERGLRRCDERGCTSILAGSTFGLAVSPDGRRLVFGELNRKGVTVQWIGRDGGEPHEIAETDTVCAPGWATDRTVWVSLRRQGRVVWTEMDADSGRETGRKVFSTHDCSDGRPDPSSPVDKDVKVICDRTSQLRLLDQEHLHARLSPRTLGNRSETR